MVLFGDCRLGVLSKPEVPLRGVVSAAVPRARDRDDE